MTVEIAQGPDLQVRMFDMLESGSNLHSMKRIPSNQLGKDSESYRLTPNHYYEQLLLRMTKLICQRYSLEFTSLSSIQRKFLTHYRCSACGLLPLYYVNVQHLKRVRCGKCGQLTAFKRTGKYGKLRKDIAIEIKKITEGGELARFAIV